MKWHQHPGPKGPRISPDRSRPGDFAHVRSLFPALAQHVHGKPLVYLDNAASTQKPRAVIDALVRFYETDNANVHRGAHALERPRHRGLRAGSRGRPAVPQRPRGRGDRLRPRGPPRRSTSWPRRSAASTSGPATRCWSPRWSTTPTSSPGSSSAMEKGARLRAVPITDRGELRLEALDGAAHPADEARRPVHVSNALGTVNPVKEVIEAAHRAGHPRARRRRPGGRRTSASTSRSSAATSTPSRGTRSTGRWASACSTARLRPARRRCPRGSSAATWSIPSASTGRRSTSRPTDSRRARRTSPVRSAWRRPWISSKGSAGTASPTTRPGCWSWPSAASRRSPGVRLVGEPAHRAGVVSFAVEDPPLSALDVGARLDGEGIAVRAGNHCCHAADGPSRRRRGPSAPRSPLYNNADDVERFASAVRAIVGGARVAVKARRGASAEEDAEAGLPRPDRRDRRGGRGRPARRVRRARRLGGALRVPDRARPQGPAPARCAEDRRPTGSAGCQSTVYLAPRVRPGTRDVVEFLADSDSELVRGLLALLQHLFSGQRAPGTCSRSTCPASSRGPGWTRT